MTKVLLIEDNIALLDSIAFELEMRDYGIMKASDGMEAIDVLQSADSLPDIIVSDIAMPNMDGYQLLEEVQKHDQWNAIPFIFLTAFDSKNAIRIGKELGVDDYLVKPFQPDDLVIAMENKLKRVQRFRDSAERRLDATRRELLHVISHELRTPLTAIYGGAELLTESIEALPEETPRRMLGLVQSGAKRMNRLVNQVLFMVQIDSGHLQQMLDKNAQQYNMIDVVNAAVELVKQDQDPEQPQVEITIHMSDGPLRVTGIQDFLVMMVSEAVRNAVNFSPPDNQIEIDVQPEGDMAVVAVRDYGPGIAPEDLPLVWKRFTQINRKHYEQQGAGLGLALVHESARLHGGDCRIESKVGEGSLFLLRLPLADY